MTVDKCKAMKKTNIIKAAFLSLTLAVFCSCGDDYTYDDSEIKERLDRLEADAASIATVPQQIASINGSIDRLKEADAAAADLMAELQDRFVEKEFVAKLNVAVCSLAVMIEDLESYVDSLETADADWVEASFATLQQQERLADNVAQLQLALENVSDSSDFRFDALIRQIDSLYSKSDWICTLFDGYYDIAQTDVRLDALRDEMAEANMADSTRISALEDSLHYVRAVIGSEYRKAIDAAIKDNNGVIDAKIEAKIYVATKDMKSQINEINGIIQSLSIRVSDIERYLNRIDGIYILLNIDDDEIVVGAGDTVTVTYSLMNASSEAQVTASSDGFYKVIMNPESNTSGTLQVICPTPFHEGFINVMGYDSKGFSCMKVIHFCGSETYFSQGQTATATCGQDILYVPVAANFDWVAQPASGSEWIHTANRTRASLSDELQLEVEPNTQAEARTGYILLYPTQGKTDTAFATIQVFQASASLEMETANYDASTYGESGIMTVKSDKGVKPAIPAACDWLTLDVQPGGSEGEYDVHYEIEPNSTNTQRYTNIDIWSADESTLLGKFHLSQYYQVFE